MVFEHFSAAGREIVSLAGDCGRRAARGDRRDAGRRSKRPRADGAVAAVLAAPFPSVEAARRFFGGPGAAAWAEGLERRAGGLWPRFDDDVMLAALDELGRTSWWHEWAQIACPTLVVRGGRGWLSDADGARMASEAPQVELATVQDAGHDVHLDAPEAVARLLANFLAP